MIRDSNDRGDLLDLVRDVTVSTSSASAMNRVRSLYHRAAHVG